MPYTPLTRLKNRLGLQDVEQQLKTHGCKKSAWKRDILVAPDCNQVAGSLFRAGFFACLPPWGRWSEGPDRDYPSMKTKRLHSIKAQLLEEGVAKP